MDRWKNSSDICRIFGIQCTGQSFRYSLLRGWISTRRWYNSKFQGRCYQTYALSSRIWIIYNTMWIDLCLFHHILHCERVQELAKPGKSLLQKLLELGWSYNYMSIICRNGFIYLQNGLDKSDPNSLQFNSWQWIR